MKHKRIMKRALLPIASVAAVTAPIVTLSFQDKNGRVPAGEMIYDNQLFNSQDEIIDYLLRTDALKVGKQTVIGDIASSYVNQEAGLINKDLMPDYDASKIKLAWKDAGGHVSSDYDAAKSTYFNPGLISSKYSDGFGNVFIDPIEAQASQKAHTIFPLMGYYELNKTDPNNPGKKNSFPTTLVNPLNNSDVQDLANAIKNNLSKMIVNTLTGADSDYSVEVDDSETLNFDDKTVDNLFDKDFMLKQLQASNPNVVFEDNGDGTFLAKSKNELKISIDLRTKDIKMGTGHYGSDEDQKIIQVGTTYGTISDSYDHPDSYRFSWNNWSGSINNDIGPTITGLDKDGVQKILNLVVKKNNGGTKTQFKMLVPSLSQPNINSITSTDLNDYTSGLKASLDKTGDNLVNAFKLDQSNPISLFLNNDSNNEISKFFESVLSPQSPNPLTPEFEQKDDDTRYNFKFPDAKDIKAVRWADHGWFVAYDDNYGRIDKVTPDSAGLTRMDKITLPSQNILKWVKWKDADAESKNKKLLHGIWTKFNNKEPLKLVVKHNKQEIFTTSIELDTNHNLHINELKNVSLVEGQKNIPDKIKHMLALFESPKPFEDYQELIKKDVIYNHVDESTIDVNYSTFFDTLKHFWYYAYKAYQSDSKTTLEELKKIKPENFFFLEDGNNANDTQVQMHTGKYSMSSYNLLTPSIGVNGLLQGSLLAKTKLDFTTIEQKAFQTSVPLLIVAYDINGKMLNLGDYPYDSEQVLKYNALNTLTPLRDFEHVFYEGSERMYLSKISTLVKVSFEGKELFFDTYNHFYEYLTNYITNKLHNGGDGYEI